MALVVPVLVFVVSIGSASAFADASGSSSHPGVPPLGLSQLPNVSGNEADSPGIDTEAAERLPHQDLNRDQALNLLSSVFGERLEEVAGEFGDLEVEKFYSDHVGVVAGGGSSSEASDGPGHDLVESLLPIRAEDPSGEKEPVDLDLEHFEGEIQPANPLVKVGIPSDLGDGISLPESGIEVRLVGAPAERSPSTIDENAAVFPNVAADTDLTVTPTPTGLETLTQLRSPAAPTVQIFKLTLPDGANLRQEGEGAAILEGDKLIATIPPPTAIDAAGSPVPVSLDASGNSLIVSTSPEPESSYPILVDPLIESLAWTSIYGSDGWGERSNSPNFFDSMMGIWGGQYGLNIKSTAGTVPAASAAEWIYYVPRYFSDYENQGVPPSTYIDNMTLAGVYWWIENESSPYAIFPYVFMGIWGENQNAWQNLVTRNGTNGQMANATVLLPNVNHSTDVKAALIAMSSGSDTQSRPRHLWIPQASIELSDQDYPKFTDGQGPEKWVNGDTVTEPIKFSASDFGLGVMALLVKAPKITGGVPTQYEQTAGCTGAFTSPCPRNWTGTFSAFYPSTMPQGEDTVELIGKDPVWHFSDQAGTQRLVKVKVDHTPPGVSVSGSITEQASLGPKQPTYAVKYKATDGTHAAAEPQAPLGSLGTGSSQFKAPAGVAADRNGHVWVVDQGNNRVEEFDESGQFIRAFGSTGSGNGQFNNPYGIAVTSEGNIWVTDMGNHRVQELSPTGAYIQQFGTAGTGGGTQFSEPAGIAAAPGGMLWVSDYMGHRIGEFRENPGGAERFVGNVSGGEVGYPNGLALDSRGYLWAVDDGCDCVKSFNSSGQYVSRFGSTGSAAGQFKLPTNIVATPSGALLVSDRENNRIEQFQSSGNFVRQFGSAGIGNGNLSAPVGLALLKGNVVFVADKNNNRIARWSNAEYDPQSGAASVKIRVDGKLEKEVAPGCLTRDCEINGEWILESKKYSAGTHTVEVIATDAVGLSYAKSVPIELQPDLTAPAVALSGSMTEQAVLGTSRPRYKLNVQSSDTAGKPQSGIAKAEITLDGKAVASNSTGCTTENCSVPLEYMLNSATAAGKHAVVAKATDGFGNVTTKTLEINIQADLTKPTIETGGALSSAPSGWVEQEGYGFTAAAKDAGYGVTSLVLKIDGTQVTSTSASCPDGGCPASIQKTISMAPYSGGAHAAEVIATDGAANASAEKWTLNVDPSGSITAAEATDTAEAVEATAPEIVEQGSANAVVKQEIAEGPQGEEEPVTLVREGGQMVSEGAPAPSTIDVVAQNGFSVGTSGFNNELELVHEGPVEVSPVATSPNASNAVIADDSTAVYSNTASSVDTIIRPAYDGIMAFRAIRNTSAPESYSWEVTLHEGEVLKQIDEQHVGVFWEDGT